MGAVLDAPPPRLTARATRGRESDGFLSRHISFAQFLATSWVPVFAILLRLASQPTATAAYVLIALYALMGPRQIVISLWLCWLFNTLNHDFFPPPLAATFLRHLVTVAAFASALVHARRSAYSNTGLLLPATFVLCCFLALHSTMVSQQPDISVMKTLSFAATVFAAIIGWRSLGDEDRELAQRFLFGTLVLVVVASLPLFALGLGAFRKNASLFQGVMVHPQNFGPTVAVLAVVLIARGLTKRKLGPWNAALLAACLLLVFLSGARVAALALVAGVTLGVVGETGRRFMTRKQVRDAMSTRRLAIFSTLACLVAVVSAPWLMPALTQFIDKGSQAETATDVALKSRGRLLDRMMASFSEHPVMGVGFGIDPAASYYGLARDPIFGLPMMATVEKGIMPVAVLEETGIVGAIFTYPWLLLLIVRATRGGFVTGSVCWAILGTNLAEANLFSPGGQGLFQIIMMMWAVTGTRVMERSTMHVRLPRQRPSNHALSGAA